MMGALHYMYVNLSDFIDIRVGYGHNVKTFEARADVLKAKVFVL